LQADTQTTVTMQNWKKFKKRYKTLKTRQQLKKRFFTLYAPGYAWHTIRMPSTEHKRNERGSVRNSRNKQRNHGHEDHSPPVSHDNKSPAVARVSRPYSWCTLATCVHNCPSTMCWRCCCLRPKCKRSYLLIYITSGSYVNKLNVRYLLKILALQIAAKQLQLATWLLLTAYRNLPTPYPTVPSPTLYDVPFSHNTKRYRQTDDRRTEHRTTSATVLPSTVG